jgi:hypothetical protein
MRLHLEQSLRVMDIGFLVTVGNERQEMVADCLGRIRRHYLDAPSSRD